MKISASEINMASASSHLLTEKEEVRVTNADGKLVSSESFYREEKEESTARARFITNGLDTVEIGKDSQQSVDVTSQADQGTGLERQRYMASVFDWAADTIDAFVAAFEAKLEEKGDLGILLVRKADLESGAMPLGLQVSLYKKAAGEFRAMAREMRPDEVIRSTETRIVENTTVQAGGTVRTADGRDISFTLDVSMSRSVQSFNTEHRQTLRMVDPLVIDLTGNGTGLSDEKMDFDLDGDGVLEQVARTASGSAFLALDLNADGKVNSGMELFGPATGDGFNELSLYDSDGNMWIDENDEIYDKLRVWIQDGSEDGVLKKLSDAGIGAIHLGNVASEFQIQDEGGQALGQVRTTGVALTETGEARAVQQIDLTV